MKKPFRINPAKPYRNEAALQTMVCKYIRFQYPNVPFYAIPNGIGKLGKRTAWISKSTGTTAGIPDLCIATGNELYNALYIELKNGTSNDITADQAYQINRLSAAGNLVVICRTLEDAVLAIDKYLALEGRDNT